MATKGGSGASVPEPESVPVETDSEEQPKVEEAKKGSKAGKNGKTPNSRSVDAVLPTSGKAAPRTSRPWLPWAIGGACVLLAAAIVGTLLLGGGKKANTNSGSANHNTQASGTRALDGVSTTGETNPTPIAVMIENIVESRPPSGLDKASVVYEALAEGGITRFLAVFGPFENIPEIGPVRSARPYYVDWAEEYGAVYAHAGGSPQALETLRNDTYLIDFNQFVNGQYFWRDHSRVAPHNLYTSSDKLAFARRDKNVPATASFVPWTFATSEQGPATPATTQSVTIDFSSFNYKVEWRYDAGTNAYARYEAGSPHKVKGGAAITAKNVVVQFVDASLLDAERLTVTTVGSGRVQALRDGRVIEGTWSKPKRGDHTRFLDASGNPIPLTPGTTWVEEVPNGRTVTITPTPT